MKIYDISQEVFGCQVYPGDPMPEKKELKSMEKGEVYNLTAFSMCAHNGTHIDAPCHFIQGGKVAAEKIPQRYYHLQVCKYISTSICDRSHSRQREKD